MYETIQMVRKAGDSMKRDIEKLQALIDENHSIVFFGGAGVSTESGIPDFRSVDGLYSQQYRYPPEKILSHSFFMSHPEEFFDFYKKKMLFLNAKPNEAHKKLAELEKAGKLSAVVTQNIDGLHQKAGSQTVYELHGSVLRNTCMNCRKHFDVQAICASEDVPRCPCGGIIKPDVVLYEENLDEWTIKKAIEAIGKADLLLVGGTSLNVYPAAGLINYFRGKAIVLINKSETSYDQKADLLFHESIGDTLKQIHM